jgi:uncharacterized protein YjdB
MKKKIFLPMIAASLLFGMGLVACNKPANDTSKQPSTSVPAKPKINVTAAGDKKALDIDEEVQLTADQEGVTWKSSDPAVATVENGKVKAIASGTVTITASKEGYQDGKISITVKKPAAVANLKLEEADHFAADGWWGTAAEGATPIYARSSGNASDGQCIAHMDNGDKETLTFTSDKAIKAEIAIMMASRTAVEDLGAVMDVKFNDAAISLAGKPFEGGDSSNFVEVSLGQQDIKVGDNVLLLEFKASAPYMDDVVLYSKETANIAVKQAPAKETITITNTELKVAVGETLQLTGAPAGVTYASADETKAAVDQNGLVTGVAAGNVGITVSKVGMISARVTVTVEKKAAANEAIVEIETGTCDPAEGEGAATFKDATGGYRVTNAFPLDAVITLNFDAPQAGAYKMVWTCRRSYNQGEFDNKFTTAFEIKVNGTAVASEAEVNGNSWADYEVAEVTLKQSQNVVTIKALTEINPINIDTLTFTLKA